MISWWKVSLTFWKYYKTPKIWSVRSKRTKVKGKKILKMRWFWCLEGGISFWFKCMLVIWLRLMLSFFRRNWRKKVGRRDCWIRVNKNKKLTRRNMRVLSKIKKSKFWVCTYFSKSYLKDLDLRSNGSDITLKTNSRPSDWKIVLNQFWCQILSILQTRWKMKKETKKKKINLHLLRIFEANWVKLLRFFPSKQKKNSVGLRCHRKSEKINCSAWISWSTSSKTRGKRRRTLELKISWQ